MSLLVPRVQEDHSFKYRDGQVVALATKMENSQQSQSGSRCRIQGQGFFDLRLGLVQVSALQSASRQPNEWLRPSGKQLVTAPQLRFGFFNLEIAEQTLGQGQSGLKMIGRRGQNMSKVGLRLFKTPEFQARVTTTHDDIHLFRLDLQPAGVGVLRLLPMLILGIPFGQSLEYLDVIW